MNYKHLILCIALAVACFNCSAQITVKPNDPHIQYMGRVDLQDTAAVLSWSGTTVKINFEGTGISYKMRDERGDNFYNVLLDGKIIKKEQVTTDGRFEHEITGLNGGKHTLELFKRTEWAMGKTWFYGFTINKGGKALPVTPVHKHKIEYFGDSISCGYAAEDSTGQDRGTAPYEDGYISYAALTARHFNADFHNTSKSGIGITVSWFPLIMPEMYDRLDATDSTSKWNFSKYTPDLVVINLFQNDSWIVEKTDNPQFKARFGTTKPKPEFIINAYRDFVAAIRNKYPKAHIICILGSMDATQTGSPWPGYIQKAVDGLNDKNIYTHFILYKNTPGHPNVKEQQAMADDLEVFVAQNMNW
ncbi:SGNH/GDSL hydrolase family protein [Mucilaginibacter sp. X5P1]|uniref:SGNH/GDSL hydrolase family protein n=1 Tax=Mucilaginibacter sp. X5P1 TaxID=2723088 RepID=UPI001612F87C|nr:SGNH/GDSL hydrolase family protein [Mucilaginibacter sp. X5P1]MBB6137486.1 lysophospholipase L1-like esterase [Mucilaginibacter sp. X5P1]